MENKTFTCKDLTEGRVACINDGTIDELRKVLKYCFPDDGYRTNGTLKYYYLMKGTTNKWNSDNSTDLPTQSVKVFLKEIEEKGKQEEIEIKINPDNNLTIKEWVVKNESETESSNPLDNLPIIGEGVDAMVSNTGMVENRAKVFCKIKDVYVAILEGKNTISTWFLAEPITPKTKITRADFEKQFEIID